MTISSESTAKSILVKVAIVGQATGILLMGLFLAIDDVPNSVQRVDPITVVLAVIAILVVLFTRLPDFVARSMSRGFLVLFVLLISVSTLLITLANVVLAFDVPEAFVTPGWEYTRATGLITLLVFLSSAIVNVVLSARILRTPE